MTVFSPTAILIIIHNGWHGRKDKHHHTGELVYHKPRYLDTSCTMYSITGNSIKLFLLIIIRGKRSVVF